MKVVEFESWCIGYGSRKFGEYSCYLLRLKSMTGVYFDYADSYVITINFFGMMYDEQLNSVMEFFKILDGDIVKNNIEYQKSKK